MTLDDCVTDAPSTGECKIDLDIAEKYFNKKSLISEYNGVYRLIRFTHKYNVVLKVTISEKDAKELTERLDLVMIPNGIFAKASTYKLKEAVG